MHFHTNEIFSKFYMLSKYVGKCIYFKVYF